MNILITGGCGFLGSNLAAHGLSENNQITVFDNLSRVGSIDNLAWLNTLGELHFVHGDIRNKNDVENLIKAGHYDAVFHLAGQVAMTTSIDNPYLDFETNVKGSLNLLDSIRKYSPDTSVLYSSTNKVYGDLEQYTYEETATRYICKEYPDGFDEHIPLSFHSPYGCSKGAAEQYMLDYSRIFGIRTVVFRHSSMYGSHQYSSYDQGWIGWFCRKAIEKFNDPKCDPFTISGNGKQVRDILNAEDVVNLYFTALQNVDVIYGEAYNIGGTMPQSLSLLELFAMLNEILDIRLDYTEIPWRASDQKVFVANTEKIRKKTGWAPQVSAYEGVSKMVEWTREVSKA